MTERIETFHRLLLEDHDLDYRIVIEPDTGDIDRFADERFGASRVGSLSATGKGLLLVLDTAQNLVRLEVGYRLEGIFTDAFTAYVQQQQMVPFFRAGRIADGVLATTELIVGRVLDAKADLEWDDDFGGPGSGGAGASVAAGIGETPDEKGKKAKQNARVATGMAPGEVVATYLGAMAAHNADSGLEIYTPQTQSMLSSWVVTPAQMDNVVGTYAGCSALPVHVDSSEQRAVIAYPVTQRGCAPWFLARVNGQWRLDLTMMQRAVRFGRNSAWRLLPGVEHEYAYAFVDWRFDANGFPLSD